MECGHEGDLPALIVLPLLAGIAPEQSILLTQLRSAPW